MDDLPLLCGLLLAVLSTDAQSLSLGHPHLARLVEATSVSVPAATMRSQKKKKTNKKKKPPPPTWGQQYKDPGGPGSLGGLHRFARNHRQRVQRLGPHLEKELAYTLHKPVRRRFPTLRVQVWGMDHQWVADLVEVQRLARHNGGTRYLLTVLDVLSKYTWVEPLKDKTGRSLAQAWECLLKRAHPRRPRQLQTDQGKEFYNRPFQQVLKKHAIHHFSTYGDTKASVIERFNRTLKKRLYRYLTAANTLKFVDVLPQVVQGYNASWHRSIGRAPQDVTPHNELEVWHRLYSSPSSPLPSPKLKAGDRVCLSKEARPFCKGYLPGWTEEVFVVRRVVPGSVPTYKVEEFDGTLVQGTFYEPELQRVTVDDDTLWRIEKVLKRRGDQWYVQWKGWPRKYDSWIRRQDLAS